MHLFEVTHVMTRSFQSIQKFLRFHSYQGTIRYEPYMSNNTCFMKKTCFSLSLSLSLSPSL